MHHRATLIAARLAIAVAVAVTAMVRLICKHHAIPIKPYHSLIRKGSNNHFIYPLPGCVLPLPSHQILTCALMPANIKHFLKHTQRRGLRGFCSWRFACVHGLLAWSSTRMLKC
mmetsp:Transcript_75755/g.209026  ORF Transcript_75755/g.209026 Transcript_75755/m.209026 type:complete len:114 (+) Transcript_75755:488-829(+)